MYNRIKSSTESVQADDFIINGFNKNIKFKKFYSFNEVIPGT